MANYIYNAKTKSGETVSGNVEASDVNMAIAFVKDKGYFPMAVYENTGHGKEFEFKVHKNVKVKDLSILCRQFHTMLNAGVSVIGCLDLLRSQTQNPTLRDAMSQLYDDVQKGKTLSESMKSLSKVFPVLMVSMVEVGEVSGTLELVLERLSIQFEKDTKVKSKVSTAMMYPAVIGCIALVMVTFMIVFIVPKFVSMVNSVGGSLPMPTRIILYISGLFTNPLFLIGFALFIAAVVFGFRRFKRTEYGKFLIDSFIFKLPMVGVNVQKILASRFTRTLSTLLKSGVSLIHALEVVDGVVNNQIVSRGLIKVKESIKMGSNLAAPLEKMGIFPLMVTHMISVGEEAGSLDSIMEKVADFYDEEVETSISKLVAMMEPILMMVLAVIIGFIVVAMILPIFSMYQGVGQ
ncbi:type II secretion system F family protein [Ruminiclostridium josui]|uniref:type II secretion system F family protein n=1 Tax=Ruminiclostridium josui TaxID=1499 RepID=UPI000463451D|nr:type II secretion system F family protein [Ruminiclostridium josui]